MRLLPLTVSVALPGEQILPLHGVEDVLLLAEERDRRQEGTERHSLAHCESLPIGPEYRSVVTPRLRSGVSLRVLTEREGEGS